MEFKHYSVMADEVIEGLNIAPDFIMVDSTLGGAGHAKRILEKLSDKGRVIGIDLDTDALENAKETVKDSRLLTWHGNYVDIADAVRYYGFEKIDGVLFDLGVSSYQIDTPERGFSYIHDAPLDMRMNKEGELTAKDVVNGYSEDELFRIIRDYGEEHYASRIARGICKYRENKIIETTVELADIITASCPAIYKKDGHPARRTFQSIRCEVNGELENLQSALKNAVDLLAPTARIAVITFHSIEDRIVKTTFASLENPCTCPKDYPICICKKKPIIKTINKKPIVCSEKEMSENSRSHSAKLRIAEKL